MLDNNILQPDMISLQGSDASRILAWFASISENPEAAGSPITVSLVHLAQDEKRLVRTFSVDQPPDPETCREFVREIERVALDDAAHLQGLKQRYILSATSAREHLGSLNLIYTSPTTFMTGDLPLDQTVLAQSIRHTEMLLMAVMQLMGPQTESMTRRIAQQDTTIERLHAAQSKFITEKEELATKRLERDLRLEDARQKMSLAALQEIDSMERSAENRKVVIDKLGTIVPLVINRVAGRDVVPVARTPLEETVSALGKHIDDNVLVNLMSGLSPEVGALLHDLVVRGRATTTSSPSSSSGSSSPPPTSSPPAASAPASTQPPVVSENADPFGPLPPTMLAAAIQINRQELLPWATTALASGKDPIKEKPYGTLLLGRIAASMPPDEFHVLFTRDERLTPEERLTLAQLVRRLGLDLQREGA